MRNRGLLIVDDDPKLNLVLASWLSQDAVPTRCVETTKEGLDIIKLRQPAVLIADLHLLDPPTIEFCEVVRRTPNTSTIPILLITSATDGDIEKSRERILSAGPSAAPVDYLSKPFTYAQLRDKLAQLVSSREWINPDPPAPAPPDVAPTEETK